MNAHHSWTALSPQAKPRVHTLDPSKARPEDGEDGVAEVTEVFGGGGCRVHGDDVTCGEFQRGGAIS